MMRNRIEALVRELAEGAAIERPMWAAAMTRARVLGFLDSRRRHAIKRFGDMIEAELCALPWGDDANGHCAGRLE